MPHPGGARRAPRAARNFDPGYSIEASCLRSPGAERERIGNPAKGPREERDLVILEDDVATSRQAIAHLIAEEHKLDVLQADHAAGPLALCRSHNPALVLLEAMLPGMDGYATAAGVRQARPAARIAILTHHNDPSLLARARRERLNGFILKRDGFEELSYAIRTILKGGFYLPPSLSSAVIEPALEPDPVESLTSRERSVFSLYAQGYGNQAIAEALHISAKTAETHVNNLRRKLGQRTAWARPADPASGREPPGRGLNRNRPGNNKGQTAVRPAPPASVVLGAARNRILLPQSSLSLRPASVSPGQLPDPESGPGIMGPGRC